MSRPAWKAPGDRPRSTRPRYCTGSGRTRARCRRRAWGGGVFFAPSPPTIPTPGLAEPQTPLRRVTASSAAGGKLFVINHVLKDDVMGAFALPLLLPRLRSPGRRAGAEPLYYKSRSQKKKKNKIQKKFKKAKTVQAQPPGGRFPPQKSPPSRGNVFPAGLKLAVGVTSRRDEPRSPTQGC